MEHETYAFAVVNSSSAEHLTQAYNALENDTVLPDPLRIRIAVGIADCFDEQNTLLSEKPSWYNGLQNLIDVQINHVSSEIIKERIKQPLARSVLTSFTGSATGNKGLTCMVTPQNIKPIEYVSPTRKCNFFQDGAANLKGGFLNRVTNSAEKQARGWNHPLRAWGIEGTTIINEQEYALQAVLKAGRGGGLVVFTSKAEVYK